MGVYSDKYGILLCNVFPVRFLESLDALTEMVGRMFGEVPNKQVTLPHWDEAPFKPEHLAKQLYMVPVKDIRSLNVVWNVPDLHQFYKTKVDSLSSGRGRFLNGIFYLSSFLQPGHYLGGLVGHEGIFTLNDRLFKTFCLTVA